MKTYLYFDACLGSVELWGFPRSSLVWCPLPSWYFDVLRSKPRQFYAWPSRLSVRT
jgi:hypothetical protein